MASRPISRILCALCDESHSAGDHLSGTAVTDGLKQPTRTSNETSSLVGGPKTPFRPAWPCSWWGLPGRRHRCRRRWSLAPPFHPRRKSCPFRQYASLLHLPSSHPARLLAGTLLYGVRTFLSFGEPKPRSPSQLATYNPTWKSSRRQQHVSREASFSRLPSSDNRTIKTGQATA